MSSAFGTGRILAPLILAGAFIVAGGGCAGSARFDSISPAQAADQPLAGLMAEAPAPAAASLFPGDQTVLTNAEIDRIFAAKVTIPPDAKIAVVRFGGPSLAAWSEELSAMDQQSLDAFVSKLSAAKHVKTVLLVPTMLMPRQTTIPYLRETAARVQADLVLVYHPASQNYLKSRFLRRDETRSYCKVEAALLDTRSGIVIYTAQAVENFSAQKSERDMSFGETIARAEQQAIGKAMSRVGDDVAGFLNQQ